MERTSPKSAHAPDARQPNSARLWRTRGHQGGSRPCHQAIAQARASRTTSAMSTTSATRPLGAPPSEAGAVVAWPARAARRRAAASSPSRAGGRRRWSAAASWTSGAGVVAVAGGAVADVSGVVGAGAGAVPVGAGAIVVGVPGSTACAGASAGTRSAASAAASSQGRRRRIAGGHASSGPVRASGPAPSGCRRRSRRSGPGRSRPGPRRRPLRPRRSRRRPAPRPAPGASIGPPARRIVASAPGAPAASRAAAVARAISEAGVPTVATTAMRGASVVCGPASPAASAPEARPVARATATPTDASRRPR